MRPYSCPDSGTRVVIKPSQQHSATHSAFSLAKSERVVKSCRANHKEISGNEEEDGKVRALFTDHFVIRYDNQFTKGRAAEMYVKDDEGFNYNIVSVVEIQRKKYLQINTVRRG